MDNYISNIYQELLKVQPVNDWRYSDSFPGQQFQQYSSGKYSNKNFNYVLCKMTNNKGRWCTAN